MDPSAEKTPLLSKQLVAPTSHQSQPLPQHAYQHNYILYGKRWLILLLFSFVALQQCTVWITYGTLADSTQQYYKVSSATVNLLAAFGPIAFLPVTLHSSWAISALGLKKTVFIASLASAVGACMRSLATSHETFWLVLVGQFLNAAAGPIVMTVPPTLSAIWFGAHERTLSTSIGAIANSFGGPMAFFLALLVVDVKSYFYLLYAEALFIVVVTIAVFFFFDDKPPTPPSASSMMTKSEGSSRGGSVDYAKAFTIKQYLQASWKLCKNVHCVNIILTMGTIAGVSSGWSAMLVIIIVNLGYTQNQAQWIGLLNGLIGLVGALFIGKLHDKFHHFKVIMFVVYFIFFLAMAFFSLATAGTLEKYFATPFWVILVITSIAGIAMSALYPLSYEVLAELSFPIPETVGSAMLSFLNNVLCLIFLFAGDTMSASLSNWTFTGVVGLGVITSLLLKEKYNRLILDDNTVAGISINVKKEEVAT